jgi:hypothetical protein
MIKIFLGLYLYISGLLESDLFDSATKLMANVLNERNIRLCEHLRAFELILVVYNEGKSAGMFK